MALLAQLSTLRCLSISCAVRPAGLLTHPLARLNDACGGHVRRLSWWQVRCAMDARDCLRRRFCQQARHWANQWPTSSPPAPHRTQLPSKLTALGLTGFNLSGSGEEPWQRDADM